MPRSCATSRDSACTEIESVASVTLCHLGPSCTMVGYVLVAVAVPRERRRERRRKHAMREQTSSKPAAKVRCVGGREERYGGGGEELACGNEGQAERGIKQNEGSGYLTLSARRETERAALGSGNLGKR